MRLAQEIARPEAELVRCLRVWLRNRRLYPAGPGHAWAEYGRRFVRAEAKKALAGLRALHPFVRTTTLPRRAAPARTA